MNVKPFLTFQQQLDLLKSRGLQVNDDVAAIKTLSEIGYYRLSGYTLTLRKDDKFYPNATFELLSEIYDFDCSLRTLVYKYVSCIEIFFKTNLSYYHAQSYGELGYTDSNNFYINTWHDKFYSRLKEEIRSSQNNYIYHYKTKYNGYYPIWVVMQIMTFGEVSKFFKNLKTREQAIFADYFHISNKQISSWLRSCVVIRNIVAHHERIFNRKLIKHAVLIKKHLREQINPVTPFAFLYVIYNLLPDDKQKESFIHELNELFNTYPNVNLKHIGIPEDWQSVIKLK